MKNIKISLILAIFAVLPACEKPDPTPEIKDASYQMYNEEIKTFEAIVKAAETAVVTAKQEMDAATPQTGQIKFAQKRYWEAVAKLDKAKQEQNLAKQRVQVRQAQIRAKYLDSYYKKTEMNEPTKDQLLAERNIASTPRDWSVSKRRAAIGLTTKSGKQEEAPKKAAPAEGGHH